MTYDQDSSTIRDSLSFRFVSISSEFYTVIEICLCAL